MSLAASFRRWDWKCKACAYVCKGAKPPQLVQHATTCRRVSAEVKAELRRLGAQAARDKMGGASFISGSVGSRSVLRQQGLAAAWRASEMPEGWQCLADAKQARAFVHGGIPFHFADDEYFLDYISYISKYRGYMPAGGWGLWKRGR